MMLFGLQQSNPFTPPAHTHAHTAMTLVPAVYHGVCDIRLDPTSVVWHCGFSILRMVRFGSDSFIVYIAIRWGRSNHSFVSTH